MGSASKYLDDPVEPKRSAASKYLDDEPGVGTAALMGGAGSASLGFNDEVGGLLGALSEKIGLTSQPKIVRAQSRDGTPIPNAAADAQEAQTFGDRYRANRDEIRGIDDASREAHPLAYHGAELATALASPLRAPGRGGGLLSQVIRPAAEGVVAGAGYSRASDASGLAKDATAGAATGGLLGAAGKAVSAGTKYVGDKVSGRLGRRILNEVAEGADGKVTGTARKHLDKAEQHIVDEVVSGPDAKAVREAFSGDAKAGRAKLGDIISGVRGKLDDAYSKFETGGKAPGKQLGFDFNAATYMDRIAAARAEAVAAGKTSVVDSLDAFASKVGRFAEENQGKPYTLKQLRGLTTEAQAIAASAVGGLNGHMPAKLKQKVSQVATGAMDDALTAAAGADPKLRAAAATIRENNGRMHGLLSIDHALELRSGKEQTAADILIKAGKYLGAPGLAAGFGAASSGDDDALENMAAYGLLGFAAPRLGRMASRKVTDLAIKSAQGDAAIPRAAAKGARAATRGLLDRQFHRDRDEDQ